MKRRMKSDGWHDTSEPTGFWNSHAGAIVINILLALMVVGCGSSIALVVFKNLIK